ncbi:hypothetical protein CWI38_1392p0020 [Hamiltosporidium tvaerminnensis]|uniref:Uncharacterized protein n=2 Tax=Hamiltosporidium TaxID=1176354 RepID=A0A4Q9L0M8_9MICR|nr:hypothetical protein CWI39_1723p0010 [Hamiltosporidium magnivora]TBU11089.1 hypothetical protein CWI38_1392p0020 [Hamiltosporidium tvaerminnensis]
MVEFREINNRTRPSENNIPNQNNNNGEDSSDYIYYDCRDISDVERPVSPVSIRRDGFYIIDVENRSSRSRNININRSRIGNVNRNLSQPSLTSSLMTVLRIITARDKSPDFLIFPLLLFIICYFFRISYVPFHLTIFVFYQYLSGNSFISFVTNFFIYYSALFVLKIIKYFIWKTLKWSFNF